MQNSEPNQAAYRRSRDAAQPADLLAIQLNRRSGWRYFVSGDTQTVEAAL
jgi:hypothetical protein